MQIISVHQDFMYMYTFKFKVHCIVNEPLLMKAVQNTSWFLLTFQWFSNWSLLVYMCMCIKPDWLCSKTPPYALPLL